MAHFDEGKGKFIEPSKVAMPVWRTVLIVLYAVWLLLWGFVSGKVKGLFGKKK
jgi:hypothetical protein